MATTDTPATAVPPSTSRRLHGAHLAVVLAALMLSLLLEALDQTVVGTALPRIIASLHGFDRYTWAIVAYLLASTTMLPLAGKLSDQLGRKWFLIGGTVTFLFGSALAGLSMTITQLIAFRAVQGIGAGIGISLVFTVVADIFPPGERARWQGLLGGVYGLSSVTGPALGGWLADHGPTLGSLVTAASRWRWVFLVNLPLGIVAVAILIAYLPADISVRTGSYTAWAALRRIDFVGAVLSVAASMCLLIGLTKAGEVGAVWRSPAVAALLVAAGSFFVAFVIAERRAVEPILPLGLFRSRIFVVESLLTVFLYMTLFGTAFFVPLFLQGVLDVSPTEAGGIMTPFSVSIVVGNLLTGAAIDKLGRYRAVTVLGTLIMAFGVLLLTRMTSHASVVVISASVTVAGLGMGILFTATTVAVQNALPPTHLGIGLGIVRYLGQIGGTLGATIVGAVVNYSLNVELARRLTTTWLTFLSPREVTQVRNAKALLDPSLQAEIRRTAVWRALSRLPHGPHHEKAMVAMAEAGHSVAHVFQVLRFSLAIAIQHGLETALAFCVAAIVVSLFLRDPGRGVSPR